MMTRYFPFLNWIRHYERGHFVSDLIAGTTVAMILLPGSMAYAQIGGLPPEIGLYASILPLVIYGLLGTSRALAIGPTAITGLVIFAVAAPLADVGSPDYITITLIIALLGGVIQLIFGVLRLGFLGNLLTAPVLAAFLNAAAIIVGMSQVGNLLGLEIPRTTYVLEPLVYALTHLHEIHPPTVAITLLGIVMLQGAKSYLPERLSRTRLPDRVQSILPRLAPLLLVIVSALVIVLLNLDGVRTVAVISAGLPPIALPEFDPTLWVSLLPGAFVMAVMCFVEGISVGKSIATRDHQSIDPNQELIAYGAANIGAAISGGMSVSASLSRSVVNHTTGVKTGVSSIVSAIIMALIVLLFMPLFRYIPGAALASIVLMAVVGMFDASLFISLWRENRLDWLTMMVTFIAVLVFGIERGIFMGIFFALGVRFYRRGRKTDTSSIY